jgi:hypothetical protein
MFLKINWDNKVKKVSLGQVKDAKAFFDLISRATDIPSAQASIKFVDGENDQLTIRDNLDFEYFLSCGTDGKYKSVFVERDGQAKVEEAKMVVEKVTEKALDDPYEQAHLQAINVNARPHRALGFYRGIDEFCHHFDEALTLRPQTPATPVKEIHAGIICDVCEATNITGKRFKCLVCVNFDVCETCEAKEAHGDHPMVRLNKKEESYVLDRLTRKFGKLKRRVERGQRIRKDHHETPCSARFGSFASMLNQEIRSAFQNHSTKTDRSDTQSQLSEASAEKKRILRFMYPSAENKVIDELIRRFESLNLTQFLQEIQLQNRILDGQL